MDEAWRTTAAPPCSHDALLEWFKSPRPQVHERAMRADAGTGYTAHFATRPAGGIDIDHLLRSAAAVRELRGARLLPGCAPNLGSDLHR